MHKTTPNSQRWLNSSLSVFLLAGALHAGTWDGDSNDDWQTAANWTGNTLPSFGNTTDVTISASGAGNLVQYLGSDSTIRSLTWNNNTGSSSIDINLQVSSGDTTARNLTFQANSGNATLTRTSGSTGTYNVFTGVGQVILASDLVIDNTGGRMQFQSVFSETGGSRSVTLQGGGQIMFAADPTFTGDLNVEEGMVFLSAGAAVDYGATINLGKGSGTTEARVDMTGGGTTTNDINVIAGSGAGVVTIGKNGNDNVNTYSGTITLGEEVLFRNAGTHRLDISGTITGSGDIRVQSNDNELRLRSGSAITTSGDFIVENGQVRQQIGGTASIGTGTIHIGAVGETTTAEFQMIGGGTTSNNIVVVSDGANAQEVRISKNTATSSQNYGGIVTLNDDLVISNPAGGTLFFQNNITGTGDILVVGDDQINFNATTDFVGDVTIAGSTADSNVHRLRINSAGSLDGGGNVSVTDGVFEFTGGTGRVTFYIGANGVNNSITGSATGRFEGEGNMHFDLSSADITDGNSWTIVGPTWESVSYTMDFNVTSTAGNFTEAASVWTLVDGNNTWSYSQATGVLSLAVSPSLNISSSTYTLTGSDQIDDTTDIIMDEGILEIAGYSDTVNRLVLSDTSTIDITAGGSITFADTSGQVWSGYLDIDGELGATSIRFGTDAAGLTVTQLARIRHGGAEVYLDANGYLRRVETVTTHSYVGGPSEFGYTYVVENFNNGSVPTPSLSGGVSGALNNGDGSYDYTITAAATDPRMDFYNAPYAFDPTDFPYLRLRYNSSAGDDLEFWPSPANTINTGAENLTASSYQEFCSRFPALALTDPVDVSIVNPFDSNGVRIDPLTAGTGSAETFQIDYVMVDAFISLGVDEFDCSTLLWTPSNLVSPAIDAAQQYLTGTAGASATDRSMSLVKTIENDQFNAVEIRVMRAAGSQGPMRLRWRAQDIGWFTAEWQPESDGQYYSYMIDLSKVSEWRDTTTIEIAVDLFDDSSANSGKAFGVDYIRLRRLPELGGGIIHSIVNWGEMLNLRFEPQWDYVLSKLRYFRSAAGQPSNAGWQGKVSASAKRHSYRVSIDGRQPWWKEIEVVDDGEGGTRNFEWVVRDPATGVPSPEHAAETFFQYIKGIALSMDANDPVTNERIFSLHPDSAFATIIFGNGNWDRGGGFYHAAYYEANPGIDISLPLGDVAVDTSLLPRAQELAADCFILMLQKLKADPATRDIKVYNFNALTIWEWDGLSRQHTNNESAPGDLVDMLDTFLAKHAIAFPNPEDSPLVGFSEDFPWQYYRKKVGHKKLNQYIEYAHERGYRYATTNNGAHPFNLDPDGDGIDDPILVRRQGYEAAWRNMRRLNVNGARPDEIHTYFWQDYFDGDNETDYELTILDEHEDADFSYTSALRRTLHQLYYGLPPARPKILSAGQGPGGVAVTWEASQEYDVAGYYVERADMVEGPFIRLNAGSPETSTSYIDATAVAGTSYFYRVITEDAPVDFPTSTSSVSAMESLPSFPVQSYAEATQFVVASDDFDDQLNPGWFSHISAPAVVADTDDDVDGVAAANDYALQVDFQSEGGANWLRYFRPAGSPVRLYEGDRLTVQWDAKQTGFNPNPEGNTFLRFGLVDSNGSRINGNTAYTDAAFLNSQGYLVAFGDITDTEFPYAHATVQRRDAPDEFLTGTSAYSQVQGLMDIMGMVPDEWTPAQSLALERRCDGWQLTTVLGGSVTSGGTTAALTTSQKIVEDPVHASFDTFFLRYAGGDSAVDYFIDNFTVTLDRAPGRVIPGDHDSGSTIAMVDGQYLDLIEGDAVIGGLSGDGTVELIANLMVGSNDMDTTFSGSFSGAGDMAKGGSGLLILDGDGNGHAGNMDVQSGILRVGGDDVLGENATIRLASGTTLETQGSAETTGILLVSGNATLDLGDGSGTFAFADSSALSWSGILTIMGTLDPTSLRFGSNDQGLSASQLSSIVYNSGPVTLNSNGYLEPAPLAPDAPDGLSAAAVSESQIDLTWNDNSNLETGYLIHRSDASGGPWSNLTSVAADVVAFSDTGLAESSTHFYQIVATGTEADSDPSVEATATTLTFAQAWRMENFGTIDNSGDAADSANPDFDFSINLLERAFGTDPEDASSYFAPTLTMEAVGVDTYPAITYRRISGGSGTTGVDYTAGGLVYSVEYTSSLSIPMAGGSVVQVGIPIEISPAIEEVTVRLEDKVESPSASFLQLSVEPE